MELESCETVEVSFINGKSPALLEDDELLESLMSKLGYVRDVMQVNTGPYPVVIYQMLNFEALCKVDEMITIAEMLWGALLKNRPPLHDEETSRKESMTAIRRRCMELQRDDIQEVILIDGKAPALLDMHDLLEAMDSRLRFVRDVMQVNTGPDPVVTYQLLNFEALCKVDEMMAIHGAMWRRFIKAERPLQS